MRVRVGATATQGQTESPAGSLPEPALPQSELEQPALPEPEEHTEGEAGGMKHKRKPNSPQHAPPPSDGEMFDFILQRFVEDPEVHQRVGETMRAMAASSEAERMITKDPTRFKPEAPPEEMRTMHLLSMLAMGYVLGYMVADFASSEGFVPTMVPNLYRE